MVFMPALYVVQRVTADRVGYVDLFDGTRELQDVELVEWRHFARYDRVLFVAPDDEVEGRTVGHLRVIEGGRKERIEDLIADGVIPGGSAR